MSGCYGNSEVTMPSNDGTSAIGASSKILPVGDINSAGRGKRRLLTSLDLAYLSSVSLFLAYVFAFNWRLTDIPALFWILLVGMGGTLLLRILTPAREDRISLCLAEILLLLFVVRFAVLYSVPGLYGFDPYQEMRISTFVLENGWNLSGPEYEIFRITYISPVIHFLASLLQLTTGLNLEAIVKWLPLAYSMGSVLLLFLIAKSFTRSSSSAVLVAFAFASLHMFLLFHALFVRESLAFVFFLGTVFTYVEGRRRKDWRWVFAAVIFGLSTVLTHHMTSFLLGAFFVVLGIVGLLHLLIPRSLSSSRSSKFGNVKSALGALSFGILLTVSTVGYWAFLTYTPIQVFVAALLDASRFQPAFFDAPNTVRTVVLVWGEILFAAAFGVLALASILRGPYHHSRWATSYLAWGGLMGAISFALLQRVIVWAQLGSTFMAARFQTFGYPFLFVLSLGYIGHLSRSRPRMRYFLIVFLLGFLLLSVYRLPNHLYSATEPDWAAGEERFYLTDSDFAALLINLNETGRIATDPFYANFFSPVRDKFSENYKFNRQLVFEDPFGTTRVAWENTTFDYVFIRTLWIQSITDEADAQYDAIQRLYNKVYSNGKVDIYSD